MIELETLKKGEGELAKYAILAPGGAFRGLLSGEGEGLTIVGALSDGNPAGLVISELLTRGEDESEAGTILIRQIYTAPEYRRNGVGSALLDSVMAQASGDGRVRAVACRYTLPASECATADRFFAARGFPGARLLVRTYSASFGALMEQSEKFAAARKAQESNPVNRAIVRVCDIPVAVAERYNRRAESSGERRPRLIELEAIDAEISVAHIKGGEINAFILVSKPSEDGDISIMSAFVRDNTGRVFYNMVRNLRMNCIGRIADGAQVQIPADTPELVDFMEMSLGGMRYLAKDTKYVRFQF